MKRCRIMIMLGGALPALMLGCCSPPITQPATAAPVAASAAQFESLTHEMQALEERMRNLQTQLEATQANVNFMKDLLNEMRYEPVVQESLLGESDATASASTAP